MLKRLYNRMLYSCCLACIFVFYSFSAYSQENFLQEPFVFTLPNGMEAMVISNHRIPVVTHMVWYRVGSADEMAGKGGIAHFLEHLMFKGTENVKPGEFSKSIHLAGGEGNAFTSYDYTGYFQQVSRENLEMVMAMEADRMKNLLLTEGQIETERQVILEERLMRVDNDQFGLFMEQADKAFWCESPYGRPIIGTKEEILNLTSEDIQAFYKKWYDPANAVLVIAGDITAEDFIPLAMKYYGEIDSHDFSDREFFWESEACFSSEALVVTDSRVEQPFLYYYWPAPSYDRDEWEYSVALSILTEILGGGFTGPLYQSLVVEKEVAIDVGLFYDSFQRGPARVIFYTLPQDNVSLEELRRAVSETFDDISAHLFSQEQVDKAVRRFQDDMVYRNDSAFELAVFYAHRLALKLSVEDMNIWLDRLIQLKADDVNKAMTRFMESQFMTAFLLPSDEKEE